MLFRPPVPAALRGGAVLLKKRVGSARNPGAVARRIVEKGMTVRDVERLAQEQAEGPSRGALRPKKTSAKNADARAVEKTLSDALGLRVELVSKGEGGELRIRYESLEQLEAISRLLTQ